VDLPTLAILLNHRLPTGSVTVGYIRPDVETLRPAAERIAAWLQAQMSPAAAAG
jgi:hypothetical protein